MRDCKNCIHRTKNGCDSWDCEFEKRMTNEEAIQVLEMVEAYGIADRAKRTAICALKNEQTDEDTDGDIVRRESVITMLNKIENAIEDGDGFQFNEWVEYAKNIPSAEKTASQVYAEALFNLYREMKDEEKTAKFKIVGNTTQHYECANCNKQVDGWDKYCKHCGARLEVE